MLSKCRNRPITERLASFPGTLLLDQSLFLHDSSSHLKLCLFTSRHIIVLSTTAAPKLSIPSKRKGLVKSHFQLVAIFGLLASSTIYAVVLNCRIAKPSPCRAALDLRDLVFIFNTYMPGLYDYIVTDTR